MLLGKKIQNIKLDDWCVILNPIESELIKTETIERIVSLFPVSSEEAAQLVEQTPIILLENISYDQAKHVKDMFTSLSVEILLTNDEFLRRKCYRTVWPSDPLRKISDFEYNEKNVAIIPEYAQNDHHEILSKESALKQISEETEHDRKFVGRIADYERKIEEKNKALAVEQQEKAILHRQIEELKDQLMSLTREIKTTKSSQSEVADITLQLEKTNELLDKKNTELSLLHEEVETYKQKERLHSDEQHEISSIQAQLDRYKEALLERDSELELMKHKMSKREGLSTSAENEAVELQEELKFKKEHIERLQGEKDKLKVLLQDVQRDNEELRQIKVHYDELRNKYVYLETELRDFASKKSKFDDLERQQLLLNERLAEHEKSIQEKNELLREQETDVHELTAQLENGREEKEQLNTRISELEEDLRIERMKNLDSQEKISQTEENLALLQTQADSLEKEKNMFQSKVENLEIETKNLSSIEQQYTQLQENFSKLTEQHQQYSNEKEREIAEQRKLIETYTANTEELALRCKKLAEDVEKKDKIIKDLTINREQQEAVEKRLKLQQEIVTHEAALREQVRNQDILEKDIVEKEKKIKEILTQQEKIEKELVRMKQAQKHLIEQAKIKEKHRTSLHSSRLNIVSPGK